MKNRMTMLLGIAAGATLGGAIGTIAGVFTDADLAGSKGFLYVWLPVIFGMVTTLIIGFKLSLYTAPSRETIGWMLLATAGAILGILEGLIGGILLKASPERTVWMWMQGWGGATLGMFLFTVVIVIYRRSK